MTIRYHNPGLVWCPLGMSVPTPSLMDRGSEIEKRIGAVLDSWLGTKYMTGQRCKGVHADCLGAIFGVVDELRRTPPTEYKQLPSDASLHDRASTIAAVRYLRDLYSPVNMIRTLAVEPGDVLVTAPPMGGAGHIMMVGARRNTLWHCNRGTGFVFAGFALPGEFQVVNAIYRFGDRETWL